MHALWHWLLYLLTWASHDPASLAAERARCAGAVNVAYAAIAQEPAAPKRDEPVNPAPDATPAAPERVAPKQPVSRPTVKESLTVPPCPQCGDTGRIYRSDGGWVKCSHGSCATGRCPTAR